MAIAISAMALWTSSLKEITYTFPHCSLISTGSFYLIKFKVVSALKQNSSSTAAGYMIKLQHILKYAMN